MDRCWRCERVGRLVRDPMMQPFQFDSVGVCLPCAKERVEVIRRYVFGASDLEIIRPPDDTVCA